jgi:hypothetical protein
MKETKQTRETRETKETRQTRETKDNIVYQNISAPVARISEYQNIRKEHEKFEAFPLPPDTLIRFPLIT